MTDTNNHWGKNPHAYCDNNPVNRIDPTGEAWWHWALGAVVVVACAVAVVAAAGGAAAAIVAVSAVGSGMAASTTAATVAAGAFIGSGMALGGSALIAASNSRGISEFNAQGDWGTVGATAFGAGLGGLDGLMIAKQPEIEKVGTIKPDNKPQSQGNLSVKYSYSTRNAGNRAVRSFELHSPHNAGPHQQWHWQQNTWKPFTNLSPEVLNIGLGRKF